MYILIFDKKYNEKIRNRVGIELSELIRDIKKYQEKIAKKK